MPVFLLNRPLLAFITLLLFSYTPALANEACGDFLKQLNHKPERAAFVSCHEDTSAQLKVLRATYRVTGRYAAEVESELMRRTAMPPLRYNCCGWESMKDNRTSGSIGISPTLYSVSMHSEETDRSARAEWSQISAFYIDVVLPLETP